MLNNKTIILLFLLSLAEYPLILAKYQVIFCAILQDNNKLLLFNTVTNHLVYLFQSLLLDSSELLSGQMEKNRVCEVLFAAAWISGEFSE